MHSPKKLFCIGILLLTMTVPGKAQSLQTLKDSCYHYLTMKDTAGFNSTYIKLYDAIEKEMDPEIYTVRKQLNEMHDKDQGIRILLMDATKAYGLEDKRTQDIRSMMHEIDSENALHVQQIIDTYGWLGPDAIGEDANETLFLCIQHVNDLIIQTKYLPILQEAVKQGNAEGWHYAFLTDRILMNEGKPQIYGTQTIKTNGETFPVPLQQPEKVDELRKEMGLGSLNSYMEDFESSWSLEKYQKELPKIETNFQNWYKKKKQ